MAAGLDLSNPVFRACVFYSVLCLTKMLSLAFLVAFRRLTKHVYIVPEDVKAFHKDKNAKPMKDKDVERVRSIHQNDLENIPLFIFLALLYTMTGPDYVTALWHFRLFTVSRLLYTVCYLIPIPSPSRTVCFGVGTMVNVSMIIRLLLATMS